MNHYCVGGSGGTRVASYIARLYFVTKKTVIFFFLFGICVCLLHRQQRKVLFLVRFQRVSVFVVTESEVSKYSSAAGIIVIILLLFLLLLAGVLLLLLL